MILMTLMIAMITIYDYNDDRDDYDGRTLWNVNEDIGGRIEAPGKGSISVNMHNHVNPSNTMHVWLACMIRTQYAHICSMHAHNTYTHTLQCKFIQHHAHILCAHTMCTQYAHMVYMNSRANHTASRCSTVQLYNLQSMIHVKHRDVISNSYTATM